MVFDNNVARHQLLGFKGNMEPDKSVSLSYLYSLICSQALYRGEHL